MMRGLVRVTSVNRLFSLIAATLFVVVAALAGWLLALDVRAYLAADEALHAMQRFRSSLLLAEKISAERGPANSLLGAELPATKLPDLGALSAARAQSDMQLQQLQALLLKQHCKDCERHLGLLQHLRTDLTIGRLQVDSLIHLPREQRTPEALAACVDGMVGVMPELLSMIGDQGTAVIASAPDTLDQVILARLAAELREYAGLMGSRFTVALATHRQFTVDELLAIARTRGRIDQLDALIVSRENQTTKIAQSAFLRMTREYMGDGLTYIARVRVAASAPGGTALTMLDFARVYVPLMTSITEFRDAVLDHAEGVLRVHRQMALLKLLGTSLGAILLALILLAMIGVLRRRVVQPLMGATQAISAIARGDLHTVVPEVRYRDEIAEMFDAIRKLKASELEKVRLEHQRDALIVELEVMAETDFLTGLANRRAFERRAALLCSAHRDEEPAIALIMLDIDHFKRINDTYGHAGGDRALMILADLCRIVWRDTDLIARVGGEEFTTLLRVKNGAQAIEMAQHLRRQLAETDLCLGRGESVSVTASFGIALAMQYQTPSLAALMQAADHMLYRAKAAGRNCVMVDRPG